MDALDLIAKIKMDLSEYEEGLDKATAKAKKGGGSISSAFGKIAATGVKAFVGAVASAGTAVGALVKKSVDAYGEYEQLVGGVQTLFTPQESMGEFIQQLEEVGVSAEEATKRYNAGTNAVIENANKAWRTAGLSANEYMDEAISMSASLIQGLGGDTEAAAKIADMAITDMSDNVNKMGTTMEDAQNAYRGLSMGNFMMLDNLKLGYKGTAAEMARLINDSGVMGDTFVATAENVKDISYDKYIEAIHAVQEQMGITGTTAEEAATTIQGSVRMAQSAWTNLVTAMGDKDADLSSYISDFVTSVSTVASTVMPVAKQALEGVGQLITELGPIIADAIPTLITDTIPSLLEAGVSMIQAILDGLQQNLPAIAQGAVKIATMLTSSLVGMLPQLLEIGLQLIIELANGISEALPQLIPTIVQVALQIVRTLIDNLPLLLDAAFTLVTALAEGIIENIDVIIEAIPELVQALVDGLVGFLPQMTKTWVKLMDCLEIALPEIIDSILNALPQIIDTIVNYWLGEGFQQTFKASVIMFGSLMKALTQIAASVVASIGMHVRQMASTIAGEAGTMIQAGIQFFGGLLSGITSKISEILGKIREFVSNVGTTIHSGFTSVLNGAKTWGSDMIKNFVSGITSKWNDLKGAVTNVANIIRNLLHFSEPDIGPLSDFHTYAPDMMDLFIKGINDNKQRLGDAVANAFDFKDSITSPELTATTQIKGNTQQTNESDIKKLLDNMNLTVNTYTVLDGEVINQKSYKYTIGRMGADTRATKVAMGGYV